MGSVLTVNLARARPNPARGSLTGIDKVPTDHAVQVRAPGPMRSGLGSGLVGDLVGNTRLHGGDEQAVYAYAREDLDAWKIRLGRDITNGMFGENLTTTGVDITGARIGERWSVGSGGLLLAVTRPRIPCRTFAAWLAVRGWIRTFTKAAMPGAYLRVITPGPVRAGDTIAVTDRPDHDVTVALVFRALTDEPELLARILEAPALPTQIRHDARTAPSPRPGTTPRPAQTKAPALRDAICETVRCSDRDNNNP
jgi:MOSC domain-containing protein YiiM